MEAYSRKVSFSERSFFGGPTVQKQALSIEYVFEGSGDLSFEDLKAAVEAVSRANPASRLVLKGFLKGLKWEAVDRSVGVRYLEAWNPDVEPLPSEAFDVKLGPTCEVVLVRGPKLRIAFRCFHGVMDGRGLLIFAAEVFKALRGESIQSYSDTVTDSELIKELAGNAQRPYRPQKFRPPLDIRRTGQRGVHGQRFFIDQHVASLPAKIAACLVAVAGRRSDKSIRFMMPVDIRHYKPKVKSLGNLSSPIYFDGKASESWEAIQEKIMLALMAKEPLRREGSEWVFDWIPLSLTKLFINFFEYVQRKRAKYLFSVYISHINLPKVALYSGPGFTCESAFVSPPPTEFFPLGVTAITIGGKTGLTVFGPRELVPESEIAMIVSSLKRVLTAAAKRRLRVR